MGPGGQGEGAGFYSETWEAFMGFFCVILLVSKRLCSDDVCASLGVLIRTRTAAQKLCWAPGAVESQDLVR